MAYRIKRYGNRKLYDPQQRRYVTLQELEEMIRGGREIVVTDARSGEDLTAVTLAQIILEIEREGRTVLPAAFLHGLIKHGESWGEFVRASLHASLEGLIGSQRETDRIFRAWAVRSGLIPPEQERPSRRPGGSRRQEGRRAAGGELPQSLQEDINALKARLRRLERGLTRKRGR
jgi:polyhydroxyalkanoate synthesis repressor PhaR